MGAMASQITSLAIVYLTIYSGAGQRKHQSSPSLAFVRGVHRSLVNSPHKGPVTREMFPFDDVNMYLGKLSRNQFSATQLRIAHQKKAYMKSTGARSSNKLLIEHQGLYSQSGKTSYRKISWSLESTGFWFILFQSLWNLTGLSAETPRCLSDFRAIILTLNLVASRLHETSYRSVNSGPR